MATIYYAGLYAIYIVIHTVYTFVHTDKTLGTFKVSDEPHKPSDFIMSMLACSDSTFADNLAMQADESFACL